jgi:hypothetical protein
VLVSPVQSVAKAEEPSTAVLARRLANQRLLLDAVVRRDARVVGAVFGVFMILGR